MPVNIYDQPFQAQYMNTYVPMPYQEILQAGAMKQERHDLSEELREDLDDQLMNSAYLKWSKEDAAMVKQKQAEFTESINSKLDEVGGDYGAVLPFIKAQRRKYQREMTSGQLGKADANYKQYHAIQDQEKKRYLKGKISKGQYEDNMAMTQAAYTGVGEVGDLQDIKIREAVDKVKIGKEMRKIAKGLEGKKSSEIYEWAVKRLPSGHKLLERIKYAKEELKKEDIAELVYEAMANDPDAMEYLRAKGEREVFRLAQQAELAGMDFEDMMRQSIEVGDEEEIGEQMKALGLDVYNEDDRNQYFRYRYGQGVVHDKLAEHAQNTGELYDIDERVEARDTRDLPTDGSGSISDNLGFISKHLAPVLPIYNVETFDAVKGALKEDKKELDTSTEDLNRVRANIESVEARIEVLKGINTPEAQGELEELESGLAFSQREIAQKTAEVNQLQSNYDAAQTIVNNINQKIYSDARYTQGQIGAVTAIDEIDNIKGTEGLTDIPQKISDTEIENLDDLNLYLPQLSNIFHELEKRGLLEEGAAENMSSTIGKALAEGDTGVLGPILASIGTLMPGTAGVPHTAAGISLSFSNIYDKFETMLLEDMLKNNPEALEYVTEDGEIDIDKARDLHEKTEERKLAAIEGGEFVESVIPITFSAPSAGLGKNIVGVINDQNTLNFNNFGGGGWSTVIDGRKIGGFSAKEFAKTVMEDNTDYAFQEFNVVMTNKVDNAGNAVHLISMKGTDANDNLVTIPGSSFFATKGDVGNKEYRELAHAYIDNPDSSREEIEMGRQMLAEMDLAPYIRPLHIEAINPGQKYRKKIPNLVHPTEKEIDKETGKEKDIPLYVQRWTGVDDTKLKYGITYDKGGKTYPLIDGVQGKDDLYKNLHEQLGVLNQEKVRSTQKKEITKVQKELRKNFTRNKGGNSAYFNNNPLNIKDTDSTFLSNAGIAPVGKDNGGHAVFATPEEGYEAGVAKIQNIADGNSKMVGYRLTDTLEDFSKTYATSPNDLKNLMGALSELGFHVFPNDTLEEIFEKVPVDKFAEAIIIKESRGSSGDKYELYKTLGII